MSDDFQHDRFQLDRFQSDRLRLHFLPPEPPASALLTTAEVAELFRVDRKTVVRWVLAGKLAAIRTPGGHRRFDEATIRDLLRYVPGQPAAD